MKRSLFASAFSALLASLTSVAFAAAIDTSGLDLNALATDLAGRRRVTSNGKIDIGCYEGSATGIAIVLR